MELLERLDLNAGYARRAGIASVVAVAVIIALAAWVRSGSVPVAGGTTVVLIGFWVIMGALLATLAPARAWTHVLVASCLIVGWPTAALVASMAAHCGGSFGLLDVPQFLFIAPVFALLAPPWTPIPFAAVAAVVGAGFGTERLVRGPLPWWIITAAVVSIPIVQKVVAVVLAMQGVHAEACPFDL